MVSFHKLWSRLLQKSAFQRAFRVRTVKAVTYKYRFHVTTFVGTCTTLYLLRVNTENKNLEIQSSMKRKSRELRFIEYASVEYKGQIFMTTLDFIDSVLEDGPRRRRRRQKLTDTDLEAIRNETLSLSNTSSSLFSSVRNGGIISYTEYVFLLSILVLPPSSFKICFNMLDADNSGGLTKDEFLTMETIFGKYSKFRRGIISTDTPKSHEEELIDDEDGLQKKQTVNTSLVIHFFGKNGTGVLHYDDFKKFMIELQKDINELEFMHHSHGLPTISEVNFAKILLKYTYLDESDYNRHIDRLLYRMDTISISPGISLEDYSTFISFLNNLNDFNLVMKFYTQTNTKATVGEFQDAVKVCTGHELSLHLINTLFHLFDTDGDGKMSYRDFIFTMKERLHRGFSTVPRKCSWESFKSCVRRNMLGSYNAGRSQRRQKHL